MHIAILLAGHTNPAMPKHFLDYHELLANLFKSLPVSRNFKFSTWPVVDGVFPDQISKYDGYLISGSSFGVYDNAPFISKLMHLIRQIYDAKKPLVGICFGHQFLANQLGGKVDYLWNKEQKKGTREVSIINNTIFKKDKTFNLIYSHQEGVVECPNDFNISASSEMVKIEGIKHKSKAIWGFQAHIEASWSFAQRQGISLNEYENSDKDGVILMEWFFNKL